MGTCADVPQQVVAEPVRLDDPRVERVPDAILGRDELEVRPRALEALGDPPQLTIEPAIADALREGQPGLRST